MNNNEIKELLELIIRQNQLIMELNRFIISRQGTIYEGTLDGNKLTIIEEDIEEINSLILKRTNNTSL